MCPASAPLWPGRLLGGAAPWRGTRAAGRYPHQTADRLATAVALDMTAHWTPTVPAYLGRVTKAHILAAVREALGDEAA